MSLDSGKVQADSKTMVGGTSGKNNGKSRPRVRQDEAGPQKDSQ